VRAGAAIAATLIVALLVIVLSEGDRRRASTNAFIRESGVQVRLEVGERRCQPQDVGSQAAGARVYAYPFVFESGPLEITVVSRGRVISRGRTPGTFGEGPVEIPLQRLVEEERPGASVCVNNRGVTPVELDGNQTPPRGSFISDLTAGQVDPTDDVRVDFLRPGSESWWSFAPAVAERFGLRKASFFGDWTMWAVFALVAATWLIALLLLRREAGPR